MNRNFFGMNLNVTMMLIMVNMVVFLVTAFNTTAVYDSNPFGSQNCCPKDVYENYCKNCEYKTCCEYTYIDYNFALIPYSIFAHPWTLITSMFMHAGIMHIFMNMLALFFIGPYVESVLGEKRFLMTYFAGGVMGGIFFILFSLFPLSLIPALGVSGYSVGVGASGAIFGIFAAIAVLRPDQRVYLFPLPVPLTLPVAVVIAFFAAMFIFGGMASVANSAHLGGIVGGAICGYYFKSRSRPVYEYDEYGNIYRY